ncbi:MAG: signal peptidase I [Vicinamibacterales bacterium]
MNWKRWLVGESPGRTVVRGLFIGAVVLAVSRTLLLPIRATGISMLPTFHDGQLLFFNTLAYRWTEPARGDIAAIAFEPDVAVLVKRIVALPGERLRIDGGVVYIDGVALQESYVQNRQPWSLDEVQLEPNDYFVIGDNRGMAMRNHTLGAVSREELVGRLAF